MSIMARLLYFLVIFSSIVYYSSATCRDYHRNCGYWARKRYCITNPSYMRKQCKKSCNLCPTTTAFRSPNSQCIDQHQNCASWASGGECRKNPKYMKDKCKKSCKMCGAVAVRTNDKKCDKGCIDKHTSCGYWSRIGSCNKNPSYMNKKCKCSCKTCGRTILTQWSRWSSCSANCLKSRERKCPIGWSCSGIRVQKAKCTTGTCAPVTSVTKPISGSGKKHYNAQSCGKKYDLIKLGAFSIGRIIGGSTTAKNAWSWQVGILRHPPPLPTDWKTAFLKKEPFCGGTLINSRIVLTAAHCIEFENQPERYLVRVGDWDVTEKEAQEEVVEVSKVVRHKGFDGSTFVNDIAMFVLKTPVKIEKTINVACLPESEESLANLKDCYVTGWGRLKSEGKRPDKLQQANIPAVNNAICNSAYVKVFKRNKVIGDGVMCAGFKAGQVDACQGDSGGPYVCKKGDRYVLQGIVSWGVGCGDVEKYGVYTRVFKYMNWIRNEMDKYLR